MKTYEVTVRKTILDAYSIQAENPEEATNLTNLAEVFSTPINRDTIDWDIESVKEVES